jgi:RimJ/RimL family protein N-acetyltransferase
MPAIRDLATLLRQLAPERLSGRFRYTVAETGTDPVLATIREDEGLTRIEEASDGEWVAIRLRVHSALEAVGLTATLAGVLASQGIPANMLAGYHHDLVLVPYARADAALVALAQLQSPPEVREFEWPELGNAAIRLRAPSMADVEDVLEVFGHPEVMRYWSRPPMRERAEAQGLLENIHEGAASGRFLQWAITRVGEDRLIGTVTLYDIDLDQGRAAIGYALGREHWGQGIARAAVRLAIAYAFDTLGLRRLEADTDPRNRASIRLLEALGFEREGLLRQRWRVGGEIQDSLLYGLLASPP